MLHDIAFAIWFFAPAAFANAAPVFAAIIPGISRLNAPIDGNRSWRGKPIFGRHKTWRGLVAGMIVATLVLWFEQALAGRFFWAANFVFPVDYAALPVLILGPLFGLGALGGDAIESFFKRQRGTASGESWIPFDQLDFIIGGLLISLPFVRLKPMDYVWVFVFWFGMHFLASYIGYLLGLKKKPI